MTANFTSKVSDGTVNNVANDSVKSTKESTRKPTNPTLYKYKMYSRLSKSLKKRWPAVKNFGEL